MPPAAKPQSAINAISPSTVSSLRPLPLSPPPNAKILQNHPIRASKLTTAPPPKVYVCGQGHGSNPVPGCGSITTVPAGGSFSETYIPYTQDGRSIKIGKTGGEVSKPILQFEYTVAAGDAQVSFDLSEVNGNPFGPYGFTLTTSAGLSKHCPSPGSHAVCPFVFTLPKNGKVFYVAVADGIGTTLCG